MTNSSHGGRPLGCFLADAFVSFKKKEEEKEEKSIARGVGVGGWGVLIGIAGAENKKAQTRFRELSIKNANYL